MTSVAASTSRQLLLLLLLSALLLLLLPSVGTVIALEDTDWTQRQFNNKVEKIFDPQQDDEVLAKLTRGEIVHMEVFTCRSGWTEEHGCKMGGRTLSVLVTFKEGGRAIFKPEQVNEISPFNFRSEIAAFHLDRLLNLCRVAPVAVRELELDELREVFENNDKYTPRCLPYCSLDNFDDYVVAKPDGAVFGSIMPWLDNLQSATPPLGWDVGDGVDDVLGVESAAEHKRHAKESIFHPPAGQQWRDFLTADWARPADMPPAPPDTQKAWSDLLIFDFLLDNKDRHRGNVLRMRRKLRSVGEVQPWRLVYMDNSNGFSRVGALGHFQKLMKGMCRFAGSTTRMLRHLHGDADVDPNESEDYDPGNGAHSHHHGRGTQTLGGMLDERMEAADPEGYSLINKDYLEGLDSRLSLVLHHLNGCVEEYGWPRVNMFYGHLDEAERLKLLHQLTAEMPRVGGNAGGVLNLRDVDPRDLPHDLNLSDLHNEL